MLAANAAGRNAPFVPGYYLSRMPYIIQQSPAELGGGCGITVSACMEHTDCSSCVSALKTNRKAPAWAAESGKKIQAKRELMVQDLSQARAEAQKGSENTGRGVVTGEKILTSLKAAMCCSALHDRNAS